MSFRDNLQHLRASRHMTQEQLAMLLGVSRQSVTKWEAEKSYPEMDKLIKMCQIFGCSLDDLVQGDLTACEAEPAATFAPNGPATDICGYDDMQRKIACMVPTGISAIIAIVGIAFLFEHETVIGLEDGLLFICIILAGVLIGCSLLIPAGIEYNAFQKAHPYIADFYTEADKAAARTAMARALIAGLACIFTGAVCLMALGKNVATENLGLCLLLLFIAGGVWLIVRYGMLLGRTNVSEYNRSVSEDIEAEDIANADIDEELREALLARKQHNKKLGSICGAIMIGATIVGLMMLFLPAMSSPDPDSFSPEGTTASIFWLAWPIGGLICGVVSVLWKGFGKERLEAEHTEASRYEAEEPQDSERA